MGSRIIHNLISQFPFVLLYGTSHLQQHLKVALFTPSLLRISSLYSSSQNKKKKECPLNQKGHLSTQKQNQALPSLLRLHFFFSKNTLKVPKTLAQHSKMFSKNRVSSHGQGRPYYSPFCSSHFVYIEDPSPLLPFQLLKSLNLKIFFLTLPLHTALELQGAFLSLESTLDE